MGLFDKAMSSAFGGGVQTEGLKSEWTTNRIITLSSNEPESLSDLKAAVDVSDPGSVAAYWVYAVTCLTADYNIGMDMMRYLFADIEPYGRGFTEGGTSGKAGWDTYFNERLKDDEYRWLPRAYFEGASPENGFHPSKPLSIALEYNRPNTETLNSQSGQLGRLNIVYIVTSHAAGNKVNIELSKFEGSDRFYVTKGAASTGLFYDQRAALTADTRAKLYT